MVKIKLYLLFIVLLFSFSANSCFIIYENFIYDSSLEERLTVKNETLVNDILGITGAPNLSGNYSFIVLTDTHIKGSAEKLENGLRNTISLYPDIKFAVVLGDITAGGESSNYDRFAEIAKNIATEKNVPVYPVLGNHDLIGNGWDRWKNKIGATRYRFDYNYTTLIILDAANLYFGENQLNWLENEIKTAGRDLFIFSHLPIFSKGFYTQSDLRERARIVYMLENKCKAMFGGHTHVRHTQKTGNVEYINIESFRDDETYCLVSVSASGSVSFEFKKM